MNIHFLKKIIIIFWALWWLLAFWTDVAGGLAHLNWLNAPWAPDSNYPYLKASLVMYSLPTWISPVLFVGIICASFVSALLFFRASITTLTQNEIVWIKHVDQAFIFSIIFWLVFFLADQCLMKFDLEENHMVQGGFELLTYLAIRLLPE